MSARFVACLALAAVPLLLQGGKDKTLTPGRAENSAVLMTATAYVDRASIVQLLGSDLGGYYTVLQVTVTPKSGKLDVQRDDFLLRTDKDGERTRPLAPTQVAGRSDLILRQVSTGGGGTGAQNSSPVWSGVPGMGGMQMPGDGQMMGNTANGTGVAATANKAAPGKVDPMVGVLQQRMLREQETEKPLTGLLVFNLEKQKLKDLELIYTTAEGPLKLRFR